MSMHLALPIALFASLMIAALSTGNALLYLIALLIPLTVVMSLVSVIIAAGTIRITASISDETVHRGEDVSLEMHVRHRGWIPIAPVLLELPSMSGGKPREIRLRDMPGRMQSLHMSIHAAHVGVYTSGIQSCSVEDLMGIFKKTIYPENAQFSMTVLPLTFHTEPLEMAPGDPGSDIMARATEDLSAPSDIREYQPGDAMKKIHWKLSLRKNELLVRKYDEPVLQDVLILMDCSPPPSWGHPRAAADIRDALLETAASLFTDQMGTDHAVRMPLTGGYRVDVEKNMGPAIGLDHLAHVNFTETDRFERVLQIESRRIRKVGCVAVISARLNYSMVDIMIQMHRMGPNLRMYLITFAPDDPNMLQLVSRLRQAGIEVTFVTPDTVASSIQS